MNEASLKIRNANSKGAISSVELIFIQFTSDIELIFLYKKTSEHEKNR